MEVERRAIDRKQELEDWAIEFVDRWAPPSAQLNLSSHEEVVKVLLVQSIMELEDRVEALETQAHACRGELAKK